MPTIVLITDSFPKYLKPKRKSIAFISNVVADSFIPNVYKRIVAIDDIPPEEILLGFKNIFIPSAKINEPKAMKDMLFINCLLFFI